MTCASKSDTEISGYTPAEYITYSDDPQHTCCHVIEAVVNAPPEVCFEWWSDWQRLVDFLDLIGQVRGACSSPVELNGALRCWSRRRRCTTGSPWQRGMSRATVACAILHQLHLMQWLLQVVRHAVDHTAWLTARSMLRVAFLAFLSDRPG